MMQSLRRHYQFWCTLWVTNYTRRIGMKSAPLILLCAIALAAANSKDVSQNGCPNNWNIEQLLPHRDCHKFYQCWDSQLVEHICPSKLYFSIEQNRCEWAEVVDCADREVPDDNNDQGGDNDGNVGGGNCDPSQAPEICSAEGSDNVLVAHENCNQFYICADGKPVAQSCPANLLFNPQNDRCDWPGHVECGDRLIPDGENGENGGNDNDGGGCDGSCGAGNNDPSQAPTICASEGSEGVLVAHEKCNKFYICNGGKPVPLQCPENLLFNPNKDQCDWPENVNCEDRDEQTGGGDSDNGGNVGAGNCDPSQAPTICAAEGSDSVLVAHENCNQYYICAAGSPLAQSCPANLLFNPQNDQCDWPQNVDCGDRVIPDGDNGSGDNGGGGSDNGGGGSDNGGGGSDNGEGGDGENVGAGNCDPSQAPTICAAEGSDSVLVAHENCNQYYICAGGSPLAQSCPANLLFNPQNDRCDWPQNVDCGDRVVPDGDNVGGDNGGGGSDNGGGGSDNGGGGDGGNVGAGNCDPSQAPTICAAEGSDSVLVAHENCNQYYICAGGSPLAQSCPANLLFNPQNDQCDWPQNVDCGDRVVPDGDNGGGDNGGGGNDNGGGGSDNGGGGDGGNVGAGNCDPSQAPTICAAEGSDSVLVAHENCNQYYICAGGSPLAQSCPANLLFNPQNDQCDWPQNVDCGDRVVPDGDNGGGDNGGGGSDNGGGGSDNGGGGSDNGGGDDGGNVGAGNCDPSQAPTICAAEGSDSVLVAHENCNQYYICAGGSPLAQSCPANLLFNPQNDQCDWPQNVDCGDRVVPGGDNEGGDNGGGDGDNGGGGSDNGGGGDGGNVGAGNCDPSQAPSICAAEGSDSVLVAHENCNQYYICAGGSPLAQSCPANLLFNPQNDQCDWPQNVDCGDRVVPDDDNESGGNGDGGSDNGGGDSDNEDNDNGSGTCNCKPEEAPAICAADNSEGVLVAHEQCNKFYVCSGGRPVALRCPGTLLFNPYTNQCDWAENVECGDRVVPDGDGDDNGSGGNDNGGGDSGGNDNGSGTCNCNPDEAPAICAADNSEGVLVAHEQCNKFYVCSGGRPVALRCPGTLLFNPYTNQCDWAENVECGDRVIPDGDTDDNGSGGNDNGGGDNGDNDNGSGNCNCNPDEAPAICAADNSEGVLVAHEQCNKFYVCNGGRPVALRCPGTLLFNPYTNQCDWAENVECGDRVIPDGDTDDNGSGGNDNGGGDNGDNDNGSGTCNCNPDEAPAICAADNSEGVLVAHEQCNKFYVCNGGRPVALRCPGTLLFNPYTNQCDWAENVECGDRVIPDGDTDDNGSGGNDNGGGDNGGNDNGSGTCNCNPDEAPAICAADDSEGVFVAHEECNKFYVCNGGRPVTLRCPEGLLYNPYTIQCDWPENVQCGNDVDNNDSDNNEGIGENEQLCHEGNGGGGNDDPLQAAAICASENSESVLVANENCNQFYICNHGRPVVVDCPATLLFNPYNDKCDWSHCVECGDRVNTGAYISMNKHLPARRALRV